METPGPDGTVNWKCRSINPDLSLNCDSVTYPVSGGLSPVRFNGTFNIEVTLRIFNANGNRLTTSPYYAKIGASAREWSLEYDTGYLPAIGSEFETTEWIQHTWYDNRLEPGDPLTISLIWIGRETSSFWADFGVQFQRIRLTMHTSYDPAEDALAYESWLYGEWSSPYPPPPP